MKCVSGGLFPVVGFCERSDGLPPTSLHAHVVITQTVPWPTIYHVTKNRNDGIHYIRLATPQDLPADFNYQ
jgi:hypothetical protein